MNREEVHAGRELPFGLVEVVASHAMGIGLVEWSSTRTTLVLKIALGIDAKGRLAVVDAPPVSLDTFDDDGNLVFATDFAPYKPGCDVFVVEKPEDRSAAGRFTLGALDLPVARGETLGPRESTFDAGDPTSSRETWTQATFDFSRFQCSPPSRRIAWPRTGFDVHLERGQQRFHARFLEPFPAVVVMPAEGRRPIARPTVVLDTVVIDPHESMLLLSFRGVLDDASGAFRGARLRIELFDAGGNALQGSVLRSTVPIVAADAARRAHAMRIDDTTTTTARIDANDLEQTANATMARPAIRSLPFAGNPDRPATINDGTRRGTSLAELRAETGSPALPAWQALEGTVALHRSPAADFIERRPSTAASPVAYAPSVPASPPHGVATAGAISAQPPPRIPPEAQPLAPAPSAPDGVPPSAAEAPPARAKPTLEEVAMLEEVQREIWKGERPLLEILGSYGLSDASWRALKRGARRS